MSDFHVVFLMSLYTFIRHLMSDFHVVLLMSLQIKALSLYSHQPGSESARTGMKTPDMAASAK